MSIKFKNVGDWADYNRYGEWLGYGEGERTDIEAYIRETCFDPESVIIEMLKGRVENRKSQKLYNWEDVGDFLIPK